MGSVDHDGRTIYSYSTILTQSPLVTTLESRPCCPIRACLCALSVVVETVGPVFDSCALGRVQLTSKNGVAYRMPA